jgi:hypothetical protein
MGRQLLGKNKKYKILVVEPCSATTPVSYPASLRNFPNGCKGHPRFYPPPDRLNLKHMRHFRLLFSYFELRYFI